MAKKKEKIILEDIELKPQVIGYTYQKKSNIGRVIFIFIIFVLVVFYINDISVFINNLIGKKSAETINNLSGTNNKDNNNNKPEENKIVYNIFSNTLEIKEGNIILNNFNFINSILTFDVLNNSDTTIDLQNKKYFIEIYSENQTLLERHKLDIGIISKGDKVSYEYNLNNSFYYIVLEEKSVEDYPVVNLAENEMGVATLTCTKDIENIIYTFKSGELSQINHTISDNNINAEDYYVKYNSYQNKVTNYSNLNGVLATFNSTLNGYTAVFNLELQNVDLSKIKEKYYYAYKEIPKVVKFEMQTYGFTCN